MAALSRLQSTATEALELLSEPDLDVRAAALAVVGSFDDPRVVDGVVPLLEDPDWWLRVTAADTLGRLEDPRAVQPLVEALKDEETRWAAVEALVSEEFLESQTFL